MGTIAEISYYLTVGERLERRLRKLKAALKDAGADPAQVKITHLPGLQRAGETEMNGKGKKMEEKCTVVCNEQHTITPQQMALLEESYKTISILPVPAAGWTAAQQLEQYAKLRASRLLDQYPHYAIGCGDIIFLSPLPVMLAAAASDVGYRASATQALATPSYVMATPDVYVLHNSRRDRREEGGKVWYTVPQDGWELHRVVCPYTK